MIDEARLDAKVGELLSVFYGKRFSTLNDMKLNQLVNKNPYLYRAIGYNDPREFIDQLLSAFVSSSDETVFGNDFLEPLALWSAGEYNPPDGSRNVTVGAGAGQDIAIETAKEYLAISVKSGKNILNAQSGKGQNAEFDALQARLRKLNKQFRAILGFGYGRKQSRKKSSVEKLAGQVFWELLTGESDYYLRVSKSIGKYAENHSREYKKAYEAKKGQLLQDFTTNFVAADGKILWDDVVKFNSSKERPRRLKEHS
jgi:hypothetical protein